MRAGAAGFDMTAQLYAGVAGATLVLAGIVGFFYSASFGSPGDVDAMFGIFDVNGWQNVVHILTGSVGLVAFAAGAGAARQCALGLGAAYLVIAVWGFVTGGDDSILGIVPVNSADNVLHLLVGLAGLAAGLAAPEKRLDRL
jgi:hypothetical protein